MSKFVKFEWMKYAFGIAWGGPDRDWYWIYPFNWLTPDVRYFGYSQDWYDGPISSFGLWYVNITWRLPWTKHNGGR